jgi:DNA-directed RNA polymerase subunit RPC12/RpoP
MTDRTYTQAEVDALLAAALPHTTEIECPQCGDKLGEVQAAQRLNLSVHCPYCGHDFGATVHPEGAEIETPEKANPPAGGWRP